MFGSFYYGSVVCGISIFGEQLPPPYDPSESGDYTEHNVPGGDIHEGSDFRDGSYGEHTRIDGNIIDGYTNNHGTLIGHTISGSRLQHTHGHYSGMYVDRDDIESGKYKEKIIDTGPLPGKEIEDN